MLGSEVRQRFTVTVEVEIRPARAEDLPALEWMGLFAAHKEIIGAAFEAQQQGEALMLLAVAGGFPVAQVWIDFVRKRPHRIATIWAVRTFYPLQGLGIGRRMMLAAEEAIRAHGIHRAELEVEPDNTAARRFYKRLGWRFTGEKSERFDLGEAQGAESFALEVWTLEKEL